METLVKFDHLLRIIEVSSLVLFVLLDAVLLILTKSYKPLIENRYYKLQIKYGILKITVIKIVIALVVVYAILTRQPASSSFISLIIIYGIVVILLLIDLIKKEPDITRYK